VGDMGDAFREYDAAKKAEKEAVLPGRQRQIRELAQHGFVVKVINDGYHYRIHSRIDLFPVRRRWHDLKTNERGHYDTPLELVEARIGVKVKDAACSTK